jgi:RimJ/RimL family protein N-acetyltransferase
MPDIYRVYSNYTEQYNLFSIATNLNSEEDFHRIFKQKLSKNYNDFLIIEDAENKFAGFIASYDFKKNDGLIKIMIYIEKEFRKNGMVGLASVDFVNALFQYYNIHKIYSETYAYNQNSIKYQLHLGLNEECRLKNYRYFDGKYWDTIYYSISREDFYAKYAKIIERFLE